MNDSKLLELLKKENCSVEFCKLALKHKDLYFGEILQFIEEIEKLSKPKDIEFNSMFTSCSNNGIEICERDYNGNALESYGHTFETEDGRKY